MIITAFLSFLRKKKIILYIINISATIAIFMLLIQTKSMFDNIYVEKIENNIKNKIIFISDDEAIDLDEILDIDHIIEVKNIDSDERSCLAIVDKYQNVEPIMKDIKTSYSCNIYDTSGLHDIKVYNIVSLIISIFLILIAIFIYLMVMLVVNSIVDGEKKDIAILKAIGYTSNHIFEIMFYRIIFIIKGSFFIRTNYRNIHTKNNKKHISKDFTN